MFLSPKTLISINSTRLDWTTYNKQPSCHISLPANSSSLLLIAPIIAQQLQLSLTAAVVKEIPLNVSVFHAIALTVAERAPEGEEGEGEWSDG